MPPFRSLAAPLLRLRVSALLAVASLAACTGNLNRGVGPMGATLPDLAAPATSVAEGIPAEPDETWQFTEVDRGSWEILVIAAPRGQVETNPAPGFTPRVMPGRGVESRAMPTAESAVLVSSDGGRVALDGLADPFRAAWSLIESPYGLVVRPPWSAVVSPSPASYEVLPHTVAPIDPAIAEPALGE